MPGGNTAGCCGDWNPESWASVWTRSWLAVASHHLFLYTDWWGGESHQTCMSFSEIVCEAQPRESPASLHVCMCVNMLKNTLITKNKWWIMRCTVFPMVWACACREQEQFRVQRFTPCIIFISNYSHSMQSNESASTNHCVFNSNLKKTNSKNSTRSARFLQCSKSTCCKFCCQFLLAFLLLTC